MATQSDSIFGDVIHSYSRAQAIADGMLVDGAKVAPDVCRQHYKHPVAFTRGVWAIVEKAVANKRCLNDVTGVVHDILHMSRVFARGRSESRISFDVVITGAGPHSVFTFEAVCGPGDDAAPVITILLAGED